jgi:hypothetical protein
MHLGRYQQAARIPLVTLESADQIRQGLWRFAIAYNAAPSAGGDTTTQKQIRRFRRLIMKANIESGALGGEMGGQKAAFFELPKKENRLG